MGIVDTMNIRDALDRARSDGMLQVRIEFAEAISRVTCDEISYDVSGEKLEDILADLRQKHREASDELDRWKVASGLEDSSGDPGDVQPEHLERFVANLKDDLGNAIREGGKLEEMARKAIARADELRKLLMQARNELGPYEGNLLFRGREHDEYARRVVAEWDRRNAIRIKIDRALFGGSEPLTSVQGEWDDETP